MAELRHAAYCATRNIYDEMETAAKSLVATTPVDVVHFVVEDSEFPRPLPDFVQVHDVSGQGFFPLDGPNANTCWTWMVLMRVALCHILEGVDTVLSLDTDTICHRDASGIWELPIDGCYFAAVTERQKSANGLQYANLGVALFNLAQLRDGKADECIEVLNKRKYAWPEQDVMNYLCQGRICEMPREYNNMWFNDPVGNPVITHYAALGDAPWKVGSEPTRYRNMTWDEAIAARRYAGKGTVLFASNHSLERDEGIRAVWDAYQGKKELVQPVEAIANVSGYDVVVTDTLTPHVQNKDFVLVNIGHGITGGKRYALDEKRRGIDKEGLKQTDYVINASTKTCDIVARQYGIPMDRVVPLGFPRSDMHVGKRKGDGGTFMAKYKRAYLYAPTFRGRNDGDRLPSIDWAKLDAMLEDDEIIVVKRHYFQREPIVAQDVDRIVEVPTSEGIAPYLNDCDAVITDYSSVLFDAYLIGKPVVLTVDDAKSYLKTRGMYFEYPNAYSSRWLYAEDNEKSLLAMLREAAQNGMTDMERDFVDKVADMCDGHAAERVCDFIADLL